MNPAVIHYWLGANGIDLISTIEGVSRLGIANEGNPLAVLIVDGFGIYALIIYKLIIMYGLAVMMHYLWKDSKVNNGTAVIVSTMVMAGGLLWQLA